MPFESTMNAPSFYEQAIFAPFAYSRNDPFGMVAAGVLPQVGHRNQDSSANPSGRQSPVRYQVIESTLADGKHLSCLIPAYQQFCIRRNGDSCGWLLLRVADYLHCVLP